jgi:lipopolysaccharide/colanic/teichoic acid biosynthesis glycosyltransferase
LVDWLNKLPIGWLFVLEQIVFIGILSGLIWYINWLYDGRQPGADKHLWVFITVGMGVAVGWYCYSFISWPPVKGNGVAYMVLGCGGVMGMLMLAPDRFIQNPIWRIPLFQQRVLILTDNLIDKYVPPEVLKPVHSRYRVVGILNGDPSLKGKRFKGVDVLGDSRDLNQIARRLKVHQVVVAMGEQRGQLPFNILLNSRLRGVRVLELADFYERVTGKTRLQNFRPSWLIFQPAFKPSLVRSWSKRLLDVVLSGLGLVVSLPCWMAVGFIWMSSGERVLINSPRVGEKGQIFNMLIFSPKIQHGLAGKVFRALHLQKLPALINVLRGEMSLVGPHADEPELAAKYEELFPYYDKLFRVKPGLLSWATVNQVNGSSYRKLRERWQYDLYYAKRASFWLDLKVLWKASGVLLGNKQIRVVKHEGVRQW